MKGDEAASPGSLPQRLRDCGHPSHPVQGMFKRGEPGSLQTQAGLTPEAESDSPSDLLRSLPGLSPTLRRSCVVIAVS